MNELVKPDTSISNDGWNEAANESNERILRGDLLKFSEGHWMSGTDLMPAGIRLVAMGTAATWVKWEDGAPTRNIARQPGQPKLEREELGDLDESKWEPGPDGSPRDPWRFTRYVYLMRPETAAAYTFSTSTWGGRDAVTDLASAIQTYRFARPGASPVVELAAKQKKTKFGQKWNPHFKVVDWVGGNVESTPAALPKPTLVHSAQSRRDMDDEIPFD
jgi:hypothetical protein